MSDKGELPKYVQISELLAIPELCMFTGGARCQEEISAVGRVLACAARGYVGRRSLAHGVGLAEQQTAATGQAVTISDPL